MLNDKFVEKNGIYRRERSHVAEPSADWVVVDAAGQTLGRLASQVAAIVRGKRKPTFTPHVDMGDNVVIVNAAKIVLTGRKMEQKLYYRHTSYLGGLRSQSLGELMAKDPAAVVLRAVQGMLPHTRLGRQMRTRVRVYAGPEHPHQAQQPRSVALNG